MKLAEALNRRSALMEKVQQLKVRLKDCIKVQEGDSPAEKPEEVIMELDRALIELQQLIYRINMTNSRSEADGRNITSLIAERDTLSQRVHTLYEGLKYLTEREDRYARYEIKFIRSVDVNDFRKIHDKSAAQLRQLDLKIQELGWNTDLIEE
ncbi:DIP1984 family protein [Parabacteroides sp. OttesenSCG-928-N08]|nr:DIP1984 family protein [Parabacteroides sp. OttesenSCG-928-N08]